MVVGYCLVRFGCRAGSSLLAYRFLFVRLDCRLIKEVVARCGSLCLMVCMDLDEDSMLVALRA